MSPRLLVLLTLITATAACSGGQTGDPGVKDNTEINPGSPDYVSLVPGLAGTVPGTHPPGPGGGQCNSPPVTFGMPEPEGGGLLLLDGARALFLDRSSGGRLVDLSDPAAPRSRARLDLGPLLYAQRVADGRVLLAVRRAQAGFALDTSRAVELGADQLLLVDVADPDAPVVLARSAIAGDIALTAVVQRDDDVRVYAVSDETVDDCLAPTKHSTLHAFGIAGDQLEPAGTLDLGEGLAAVAVRGTQLLVLDGQIDQRTGSVSAPATLSVVALDRSDNALQRSAAVPAPVPLGMLQPQLWVERGDAIWTMAAVTADATHVARYDTSDPTAPHMLSDCTLPSAGQLGGLFVLGERAFVPSWPNQDGNRLFELDSASCAVSERPYLWLARVPGTDALVELDFGSGGAIEARVITTGGSDPVAVARATFDRAMDSFDTGSMPWASSVLADAVGWRSSGGVLEPHLLAVPLEPAGSAHGETALQLFSFSARSISARSTLVPGASLAAATASGVVTRALGDRGVLTSFALDPNAPPELRGQLTLHPSFARGYALDDAHWARLQEPLAADRKGEPEDLSDDELLHPDAAALAALEVIAIGGDPEQAPVLAHVAVNPYAQLVRVGELFVSVANRERSAPGTTRLELFDFADPLAPRARGVLETDALWAQDNSGQLRGPAIECLDCDAPGGDGPVALATTHALVLRGYRWIGDGQNGHSSFAFEIVDMSDPDHPQLGRTLSMPEQDQAIGAVAVGDSVYYRYLRPVSGDPTRARFYVQRIDLTDPAAPALPDPLNVPGELVAVRDASSLYTVEVTRGAVQTRAVLHRLQVRDGVARIAASYMLGDRLPRAVSLDDGGRLLVDLDVPFDSLVLPVDGVPDSPAQPLHLLVLAADSLELLAEGDIAYGASRLGEAQRTAVYSTWGGVLLVDVSAPSDIERQRFLPGTGVPLTGVRPQFANGHVLLADSDSGSLRDIALDLLQAP